MLAAQASAGAIPKEVPPSEVEVASTTDALAQLRMKRREESSRSGESRKTMQQLEAEAAPFDEVPEVVPEVERGEKGKTFIYYQQDKIVQKIKLKT